MERIVSNQPCGSRKSIFRAARISDDCQIGTILEHFPTDCLQAGGQSDFYETGAIFKRVNRCRYVCRAVLARTDVFNAFGYDNLFESASFESVSVEEHQTRRQSDLFERGAAVKHIFCQTFQLVVESHRGEFLAVGKYIFGVFGQSGQRNRLQITLAERILTDFRHVGQRKLGYAAAGERVLCDKSNSVEHIFLAVCPHLDCRKFGAVVEHVTAYLEIVYVCGQYDGCERLAFGKQIYVGTCSALRRGRTETLNGGRYDD